MKNEKTHISCRISGEVFTLLEAAETERGESRTRIVEQALLAFLSPSATQEESLIETKETGLLEALEGLTIQATRIANLLENAHTHSHTNAHNRNTNVTQEEHTSNTDTHTDEHNRNTELQPPSAKPEEGKKKPKANAKRVLYQGEERVLIDLLEELGLKEDRNAIRKRMERGDTAEEAIAKSLPPSHS